MAGEPDRLGGQVDPPPVPGGVDEIDDPQHDREVAGLVEGTPAQAVLGPADPLCHGRLRDVEGVGDLSGGEAADRAQGERHLGGGCEVGMAAAEEQEEGVVSGLRGGRLRLRPFVQRALASAAGGFAAARVDQPPGRDRVQPRVGVLWGVLGPDAQRFHERLLQRVLGSVEVFAAADQTRQHPGDEGAQRALVPPVRRPARHADQTPDAGAVMTSRTSIHSYSGSPPGPGSEET